jgi:hypothetical protein
VSGRDQSDVATICHFFGLIVSEPLQEENGADILTENGDTIYT